MNVLHKRKRKITRLTAHGEDIETGQLVGTAIRGVVVDKDATPLLVFWSNLEHQLASLCDSHIGRPQFDDDLIRLSLFHRMHVRREVVPARQIRKALVAQLAQRDTLPSLCEGDRVTSCACRADIVSLSTVSPLFLGDSPV
jgi:hypothetical protein